MIDQIPAVPSQLCPSQGRQHVRQKVNPPIENQTHRESCKSLSADNAAPTTSTVTLHSSVMASRSPAGDTSDLSHAPNSVRRGTLHTRVVPVIPTYTATNPTEKRKSRLKRRIHSRNIPFKVSQQTASCRCAHRVQFGVG